MIRPRGLIRYTFAMVLIGAAMTAPARAQDARGGAKTASDAPKQPIAFSHKVHAGNMKIECKMCHPNPNPGDVMTIAPASTCMQCHSTIKADSPEIKRLAGYAKSGTAVPWVPVYELPSFVNFNHRIHLSKGNTCQDCHGAVATRDVLFQEMPMTMSSCVNCHQAKKATLDCGSCHELPN
jgi:hypothetical protein